MFDLKSFYCIKFVFFYLYCYTIKARCLVLVCFHMPCNFQILKVNQTLDLFIILALFSIGL
jgi:hypothetical protein